MRKYLKLLTIFEEAPFWMYDWVLKTPLEGIVHDAPQKELAIAPVSEILTTTTLQNYPQ